MAPRSNASTPLSQRVDSWFQARGQQVLPFQRQVWSARAAGQSGLIDAPTGSGKTLAAWLGALLDPARRDSGLSVLWITPMRALAADTAGHLQRSVAELELPWTVELRTGDTGSSVRARQRRQMPNALVTTPESASLLLSYADLIPALSGVQTVIVDEWHELLGSKRGVQTELLLSRLRALSPGLCTWGLSATLGNLDQALGVLLGPGQTGHCVSARLDKPVRIQTLLPETVERFPWGGHMGLAMVPAVAEAIGSAHSTLVFTNTRAQAERWCEALRAHAPGLRLALHHGSLDVALRRAAEDGIRGGDLDAVVATSSLDLGVDFSPVDQVIQVGGPKGIARLLQRAGRSGHQPGRESLIRCIATQAVELAEFAAARRAAARQRIESRRPLTHCLDVLAQHVVTLALTGRCRAAQIRGEIAATHAYADLSEAEWRWVLDFVMRGGASLAAYPQYRKVIETESGLLGVPDATIASRHRMSIGTITADNLMRVAFVRGGALGHVEESFVARLRPGDSFLFAGRALTLVRTKDMVAQVKPGGSGQRIPRWQGGKMPLSSELAEGMLELLAGGDADEAEMQALAPLLAVQAQWSRRPQPGRLLVERSRSREGVHLFVFPFAGRHVHEGLSALMAYRLGRRLPASFSFSVNDYGFELLARELPDLEPDELRSLFSLQDLDADLIGSLNASEMARRRFREIARIAGLVFEGYPGKSKSVKQVQASAGLIFDVLQRYDPDNLLTQQALREALDHQLDVQRLRQTCARLQAEPIDLQDTPRFTPLAFPLWAERISSSLSTEDWQTRIARMLDTLDDAAGGPRGPRPDRTEAPAAPGGNTKEKTPARARQRFRPRMSSLRPR